MPEFWYEAPTNGEVAAREALPSHSTMLALSVLVFALLIVALLIAR